MSKNDEEQQTSNNIDPLGNNSQQSNDNLNLVQQSQLNSNSLQQSTTATGNQLVHNNSNQIQANILGNPNTSNSTNVSAAAAAAAAQSMLLGKNADRKYHMFISGWTHFSFASFSLFLFFP